MKFARYLSDTHTPEWKRAYIDYRGLKKLITLIKDAQENGILQPVGEQSDSPEASTSAEGHRSIPSNRAPLDTIAHASYGSTGRTPPLVIRDSGPMSPPPVDLPEATLPLPAERNKDRMRTSIASADVASVTNASSSSPARLRPSRAKTDYFDARSHPAVDSSFSGAGNVVTPMPASSASQGGFLSHLRLRQSARTHQQTDSYSARVVLPLAVIMPSLTALERRFVEKLDKELEKVEGFYGAREREAMIRASALKEQLRELQDHRRLFHEAKAAESTWTSLLVPRSVADRFSELPISSMGRGGKSNCIGRTKASQFSKTSSRNLNGKEREDSRSSSPHPHGANEREARLDPDEYKGAKKDLKKAILEYYRGLELLNNYRVLNMTGFRKALKKFEKTAKVSIQQAYMQEKVEISAFASGDSIEKLVKEMEDLYAARFQRGDIKRARERLRATAKHKTHHSSTFRSGLYIGLAVPALADGIYKSFQPNIRASLLEWSALLYVYIVFMIPVVFSLLVGINIWLWNRSRINYQFIFELDVRTQLDSREYFELPSFLLSTLIYAFWLSYSQIGTHNIASTTWPLIWLAFALVILFNPLPLLFPNSRLWFTRKVGKLLISGTMPVEFTDFWLGDQFCSLMFTLSNIYFFGCAYEQKWHNVWTTCNQSKHWGIPFALGILPLVVRAVQSVKRYIDSRLYTHLINGGKYCSSIIYYAFYYVWRHHNTGHDYTLVLFCIFATIASIYTCAWDLSMDWSLFKRPAQHRFLRKDIVYSSNYFVYYIAIILNIIIRFIWIFYVIDIDVNIQMRTCIVAMLEMLRRWQWNFFRLENEHIGNTDQYRVTREVPLPYHIDSMDHDDSDDEGDEDDEQFSTKSSWRRRPVRLTQVSTDMERQGPDEQ
ncbi:hypothetical protein EW145_g196 [Phellinidium pouzarii]|uniref:SPX domain-containing protein n=1 Tax=Phellinidium pouzarii TaxID=167371 RepID=A0A4S4LJD5_9AGAM|nr:hypothetical protein EW145_g196 [Phellinidium pouzarii]